MDRLTELWGQIFWLVGALAAFVIAWELALDKYRAQTKRLFRNLFRLLFKQPIEKALVGSPRQPATQSRASAATHERDSR